MLVVYENENEQAGPIGLGLCAIAYCFGAVIIAALSSLLVTGRSGRYGRLYKGSPEQRLET